MCNEDILNKVIEMFATMTDVEEITEESELIEDLGISSMDVLLLISNMEAEFQVKVPETAIRKMFTIADVAEIIEELMAK